MSTVLICRELPYPPTTGAPLRMWQQLNLLAKRGPVHVFTLSGDAATLQSMPLATTWEHIDPTAVRVRRWPGPLRIMRALLPPRYPSVFGDFADGALDARLRTFIARARPTHIVLSHWNAAMPAALTEHGGGSTVVLDTHNIEWRLQSDRDVKRTLVAKIRDWGFKRRERKLFEQAAKIWVTSEEDLATARALAPAAADRISVWPNAIDVERIDRWLAERAARGAPLEPCWPTIIFVGYMAYGPNETAALDAIRRIFPTIKERFTNARLLLVGKDPRPVIYEAAMNDPQIIVTGTVPDVLPYLALADVAIVPLSVGGGTRLKILEAFAAGVPIVSTSKGAEGIASARSHDIVIEDDLDAMGARIVELLGDSADMRARAQAGRQRVTSEFSWTALSDGLDGALGPSSCEVTHDATRV